MDMSHFIQPFGLLPLLAILNNPAVKSCAGFLCGHVFSLLLGIDLGVELLGHMVILCLKF